MSQFQGQLRYQLCQESVIKSEWKFPTQVSSAFLQFASAILISCLNMALSVCQWLKVEHQQISSFHDCACVYKATSKLPVGEAANISLNHVQQFQFPYTLTPLCGVFPCSCEWFTRPFTCGMRPWKQLLLKPSVSKLPFIWLHWDAWAQNFYHPLVEVWIVLTCGMVEVQGSTVPGYFPSYREVAQTWCHHMYTNLHTFTS